MMGQFNPFSDSVFQKNGKGDNTSLGVPKTFCHIYNGEKGQVTPNYYPFYIDIDYIQSDGEQYILLDNDSNPNGRKTRIVTEFTTLNSFLSGSNHIISGYSSSINSGYCLYYGFSSTQLFSVCSYASGSNSSGIISTSYDILTNTAYTMDSIYDYSSRTVTQKVNDFDPETAELTSAPDRPLMLFAAGYSDGYGIRCKAAIKLHSCKIYFDDELVYDLVPKIRGTGLKPGLLNLIDDRFYYNNGSGEFVTPEIVI